ncbi:MAG TPA: mechanosensitive ion channel domain-containing protein [Terriglobales bacterium]|nr:mechanosensitive ion channel domain-containing protein [Terriglobales bacterium]
MAVLVSGLPAQVTPAVSDLPSDQQLIAFLTQSIAWYRHLGVETQIAANPVDVVFLEDNRVIAAQILQLSFDFARAEASVASLSPRGTQQTDTAAAGGASPELARVIQVQAQAEIAAREATQQMEDLKKQLVTARGADRHKLLAALDATRSRLDLLNAGLASLHEVVEFARTTGGRGTGDLTSTVEDLARTVPNVTNAVPPSKTLNSDLGAAIGPRGTGILGISSEVSALARKLRIVDEEIRETANLRLSTQALRNPLAAYFDKQFSVMATKVLQANDPQALQLQKAQLDELRGRVKALAPAIVALDKQIVLLGAYTSHLNTWRAAVVSENEKAWKNLILHVLGVAVVIGALLIIGVVARRATRRHVRDVERRHVMLVVQRVVLWFTMVVVGAFAFASDWTSLATFFGLVTAGIAVALQSFIVSAAGYFVLVGRRGIRIGDRVQISGVMGDVTDIGWLQFQVGEIDSRTQQPTGNVVTFSNSLVLSSPATGLSKLNRDYVKPPKKEAAATTER